MPAPTNMTRRLKGVRRNRRTLKVCPKGYIKRSAYMRYTQKGKHILTPESCIRDRGSPGKGYPNGPGIGPLKKGELAKYGYTNVLNMTVSERHKALDKAVNEFGSLSVFRKLNAVAIYLKRTSPSSSRIFKEDMNYIRKKFGITAF